MCLKRSSEIQERITINPLVHSKELSVWIEITCRLGSRCHNYYHLLTSAAIEGSSYVRYQLSILILITTLRESYYSYFTSRKRKNQDMSFGQGYLWMFKYQSILVQHPKVDAKLLGMLMGTSLQRVSIYKQRNLFLNIENEKMTKRRSIIKSK